MTIRRNRKTILTILEANPLRIRNTTRRSSHHSRNIITAPSKRQNEKTTTLHERHPLIAKITDKLLSPQSSPSIINQLQRRLMLTSRLQQLTHITTLINNHSLAMQNIHLRIPLNQTPVLIQTTRQKPVIITHTDHIITRTKLQATIPVLTQMLSTQIALIHKIPYPGVTQARTNHPTQILRRAVVHHNQLPITASLSNDTVNSLTQITPFI